jgi:multiple sugar transport system ATP-binding protein
MASVTIVGIRKTYGNLEILHGFDLRIADGQFIVLLGPSGCGKSTLLRMIAGLESITSGTISIGSEVVNDIPPKDRNIAMVFQNYALYAHMSVFDNMAFSMRLKKISEAEIRERVTRAASILGLEPFMDRLPRQLSGGQRQRVAMGRAIVRDPHVFLFDEPLSNLDAKLRVQMRTEIKELHQRLRTTTVYVTHDQIEAMTMADFVVIMRDGSIEQIGKPLEVYDSPANLFVAEFIGSPGINLIDGEVAAENGRPVLRGGAISLPLPHDTSLKRGQKIIYGIRPEHLRAALDAPADGSGIDGRITVIEPTGAETHIYAEADGREICAVSRDRLDWTPGAPISLVPALEHVHLFDHATRSSIRA